MRQEILNPDLAQPVYMMGGYVVAAVALVIVVTDSVMKEQKKDVYAFLQSRRILTRWTVCYLIIFLTLGSFIFTRGIGGFMYANF